MKISPLELIADVNIMTAVDGQGEYQPLPKGSLEKKIRGELSDLIRDGVINFIVVARSQRDNADIGYGLPTNIPTQCTLIEAQNFTDLLTQLEEQGGRFGMELRREARGDYSALRLLRHVADSKWDQLYQVPQLHEMKVVTGPRIRPPREDGEPGADEWRDERSRSPGMHEWEEVLDAERLSMVHEVSSDELLDGLCTQARSYSKILVIGPPGSGKSSFLGWLARKLATGRSEGARPFPLIIKLPYWEKAWAKADKNDDTCDLLDYLVSATTMIAPDEPEDKRRRFLQNWLANGRLALLFDGLDEIGDHFFDDFAAEIKRLPDKARFVISCRTVWQKRYEALNLPLIYLAGLSTEQRDNYIAAFPWDGDGGEERREELINHLPQAPGVATLATNPQMLSFLCHTVNWDPDLPLPLVRAELIDAMLRSLLEKPPTGKRKPKQLLADEGYDTGAVTGWLGKIAFELFTSDETHELVFSRKRLGALFNKALGKNEPKLRKLFIDEMNWRGILRDHPKGFFFFHLIVQEYLIAHALAGLIEEKGLEVELRFGSEAKPLGEWLYDWSLTPRWEEIMLLTAGLLDEPAGYLNHIFCEARDTLFRHRLSLAARMTVEIPASRYDDIRAKKVAEKIIDLARDIWCRLSYHARFQRSIIENINKSAHAIWRRPDKGRKIDKTFQNILLEDIEHHTDQVLSFISELGTSIEIEKFVFLLQTKLKDKSVFLRAKLNIFLCQISGVEPNEELISELLDVKNFDVLNDECRVTGEILSLLPASQLREVVLPVLVERMESNDDWTAAFAAEVIGGMGRAGAEREIVDILLGKLSHEGLIVRRSVIGALGEMGEFITQKKVAHALLRIALHDHDSEIRLSAAYALGNMVQFAGDERVIQTLLYRVKNIDRPVQRSAIETLGAIGAHAKRKDVTSVLFEIAIDDSMEIPVITSLGQIYRGDADERVVRVLLKGLNSDASGMRHAATTAIAKLGEAGARDDVINALLQRHGEDWEGFLDDKQLQEIAAEKIADGMPPNEIFFLGPHGAVIDALEQLGLGAVDSKNLQSMLEYGFSVSTDISLQYLFHELSFLGLAANRPPITTLLEECANSAKQRRTVRAAAREALVKIRS